ncbi:MAG: TIGR04282 family arsenosugar biosynthesis glycosyltransferase [Planctomycetota bacterium]|jgi:rSAM/selenodomain-associated transferase 1
MENRNRIIIFLKDPEQAEAKTRLAAELGRDLAVKIYRSFVLDTLSTLTTLDTPITIFFYPPEAAERIAEWLGPECEYRPQSGRDLGQRMKNAFLQTFDQAAEKIVLVGSDIPDIPPEFVNQAFEALDSKDAVIGPACDGGYYLIGFEKETFLPQAFENIQWSTPTTFDQTINALNRNKLETQTLPPWHDIDTVSDLTDLVIRNHNTPFQQSRTYLSILEANRKTAD